MMELIGYICAALIGLSLGLIGGGGSILTVPVLVYLFGFAPILATSYSLFIVGVSSLAGAWNNFRKGQVDFPIAFLFGSTSIITVVVTRKLIIPRIPHHLGYIGSFEVTYSWMTMVLFAVLMMLASISMIRKATYRPLPHKSRIQLLLYGMVIGLVTGFHHRDHNRRFV
jgi:uncharacterized membrane protein YfcA